ncbi:phosphatase PAP2 family protein [uncultured Gimesia sp.]|uniref:phosphatase PAP2 family protein n=1 Tax=uncultured Gimesia sp. TaxID=1678688 RepID=UPI0030DBD2BD|tara:strand:+ start:42347 stop:43528 length:1182 start_codon:yes stop_codon:yes gene_type:complete
MISSQTLTLHTGYARCRLRGCQILVSWCISALVLLTGCVTTKQTEHINSFVTRDFSTELSESPGYQRVSEPIVVGSEVETADEVRNGSTYPDWLHMPPEGIHYPPLHQPAEIVEDPFGPGSEPPALITVEGFLSNAPVGGSNEFDRTFDDGLQGEQLTLWSQVKADHVNYYSQESLTWLAGGFGVGAIMANTSLDGGIQNHFQSSVHSASSDEWLHGLHAQKELGNGRYTLPLFAAAWAAGALFEKIPLVNATGEWGERSIRAIIVGTPPMLAMQYVTGASRPGETTANANWKPFQDNNGVSGHSFMGAIPFLAAAKMTDKPLLKLVFYAGSTLAPLSRVNDNRHYPSQVFLGWWMAWIATNAVDATQNADRNWSVFPISYSGGTGIAFEYRW